MIVKGKIPKYADFCMALMMGNRRSLLTAPVRCLAKGTCFGNSVARMALAMTTRIWDSLIPALAGLVPVAAMGVFCWWYWKRRNERTQPPQTEKLLRPPGRSLALKLDDMIDSVILSWNIDHVVVGPPGVFLIETKARNRVRGRSDQPAHKVYVRGNRLQFPSGEDLKAIPQAERNAKWMAEYLTKKTGEKVEVEALVVLPGWFVEIKQPPSNGTGVMNAKYMGQYLRGRPVRLPEAQVRRIIGQLDEKCRDMEF
jgi:hypothetical protein